VTLAGLVKAGSIKLYLCDDDPYQTTPFGTDAGDQNQTLESSACGRLQSSPLIQRSSQLSRLRSQAAYCPKTLFSRGMQVRDSTRSKFYYPTAHIQLFLGNRRWLSERAAVPTMGECDVRRKIKAEETDSTRNSRAGPAERHLRQEPRERTAASQSRRTPESLAPRSEGQEVIRVETAYGFLHSSLRHSLH